MGLLFYGSIIVFCWKRAFREIGVYCTCWFGKLNCNETTVWQTIETNARSFMFLRENSFWVENGIFLNGFCVRNDVYHDRIKHAFRKNRIKISSYFKQFVDNRRFCVFVADLSSSLRQHLANKPVVFFKASIVINCYFYKYPFVRLT